MTDETASDPREPAVARVYGPMFGIPGVVVKRVLRVGYLVVLAAFVLAWIFGGATRESNVLLQVLWTTVALLATGALWMAHVHTLDVESRFWLFMSVGSVCILAGQLYYAVYVATAPSAAPASVPLTIGFDAAAVLVFMALLASLARFRHASMAARARFVIDIVGACVVASGALSVGIIGPWLDRYGADPLWARSLYSAAPIIGLLVLTGTAWVVLGMRFDRWESWERLLGLSVAAFGVGLLVAPVAYADATWHVAGGWANSLIDLAWITGIYMAMAAAIYRHIDYERPWRLRPLAILEPSYGWVPSVVLPAMEIIAIPAFGIAAAQATDPASRSLRLAVVGIVAVLLAIRTLLTVADTDTLLAGAAIDPLTGLHSHRHFQEQLASEIASAVRYRENVSLISLDIDDFQRVNSAGGHGAGDLTMVEVARAVERAVRARDVVCRTGGDEIAVILPGADSNAAFAVALRALSEVRSIPGSVGRSLTASAGVASYPQHAADRDQLTRRAEGALYWAKTHGKDRVTVYDPDVVVALDAEEAIRELRQRADLEAVRALAAAVDARDEATQDHSRNVARHAVALARELGLDDQTALQIEFAGLLHDVGMIGVPDSVLRKSGALNADERARMEAHAGLGEQILSSTQMREILPWVRHHHERWDGTGYPDGLSGEDIPLGARILALANSYDAMRSNRPYRAAMSRSAALQEIDLNLGAWFDPVLGERFIEVVGRTYL